jgi:hypothetical protein
MGYPLLANDGLVLDNLRLTLTEVHVLHNFGNLAREFRVKEFHDFACSSKLFLRFESFARLKEYFGDM